MNKDLILCRLIAPEWLLEENSSLQRTVEGLLSREEIRKYNAAGYNVYWFPNHPQNYTGGNVSGADVDTFEYVFVDFDLKSGTHASKDAFIEHVSQTCPFPSLLVDSGNGIHVYWRVVDLDPVSYLRLSRRFMRLLNTDPAVGKILQLMRLSDTYNTKVKDQYKWCVKEHESEVTYTCEELDKLLPPITSEDEAFCQHHLDKTYNPEAVNTDIDYTLPSSFGKLLESNHEAKSIWAGDSDDRSRDDYRLGHIMLAHEFTKEEAIRVLVNSAKAMTRAPIHRINYAKNIVDKIWTYEKKEDGLDLSESIHEILHRTEETPNGIPFRCHKRIDNTVHGFRLGHVIGLVAGVGVGKTAFALNMLRWFSQENPEYHHMVVPLEQPAHEIAQRWKTMCGEDNVLNNKVHILSNYDKDGNYRNLSLADISKYILKWQKTTGNKLGCVVIDHIGVLKKRGSNDEKQDIIDLCHSMKAFAIQTNTLLIMQSQTSREKAGIGDLELNKDAAYGTVHFEAYCDYLITMWQPLKRCHSLKDCPTVTAFKYCKIRHKKTREDVIQEDVPYYMYFDSTNESLRDITQSEEVSFKFFLSKATNLRKLDRKTELIEYKSVPYRGDNDTETNSNRQPGTTQDTKPVS